VASKNFADTSKLHFVRHSRIFCLLYEAPMTLEEFKKKVKRLPDGPGVYFFLNKRKKILYIGKAASVRDRVRSYFAKDLHEARSPLVVKMVADAVSIDFRKTDSVLEALILEANLIKHYKPKGNTDLKDDKTWNYVVFTKEAFPRVLLVRGKELEGGAIDFVIGKQFGPFPHGSQLKEALKIIRKIFPYRDKCLPGAGRPCFNRQIGLCPGVCTGEISKAEYGQSMHRLGFLFAGKKVVLLRDLERSMKQAAKEEKFEAAVRLRKQLFALKHIQDISLVKEEYRAPKGGTPGFRIEAYDAAHLQGTAAVGVMVVVEDGAPQRSEYRKFRLRSTKAGDDAGALREVLTRRLGHNEWPFPKLIVVDGSTAQRNAAERVLKQYGMAIPVVGVVKDEKHRPRSIAGGGQSATGRDKEILLANAEAHRYAIGFHRRRLSKEFR